MALELLTQISERPVSDLDYDYRGWKLNTLGGRPLISNDLGASHLLSFGYKLLHSAVRASYPQLVKDQSSTLHQNLSDKSDSPTEFCDLLEDAYEDHSALTVCLMSPVREYEGLISQQLGLSSLSFIKYFSSGGLPKVTLKTLSTSLLGSVADAKEVWKLYGAQHTFLSYEHALDKEMIKSMKSLMDPHIPVSVEELELCFGSAFKAAVDNLGGIEKFTEVREALYHAYTLFEESADLDHSFSAHITHFRKVNKLKTELYHAISNLCVDELREKARETSLPDEVVLQRYAMR
ncbi:hypothetical protein HZB02_07485 [Candidatus Woesearchaeota archaeon]|nr:hypothetical protein [Candidatus Woesearchaeota archaeon]